MSIVLFATISVYAQKPAVNSKTIYKDTAGIVISKEKFEKLKEELKGKFLANALVVNKHNVITEMELKSNKAFMKEMMEKTGKYRKEWEGKNAPDFVAKDLDENKVSLKKLKGKVVVLKFWFTSCMPCLEEMPGLNKMIENKYKDNKDVVFLAPCLDPKTEVIKETLVKHPFRYTSLYNARDITKSYDIPGFPTHFVIDKNGIVTYVQTASNGSTKGLELAIDKALSGNFKNKK